MKNLKANSKKNNVTEGYENKKENHLKLTFMASIWDVLWLFSMNSFRGLDIFQARSSLETLLSVTESIKSLKGRELIDLKATYSRTIVDKLQICKQNQYKEKNWKRFKSALSYTCAQE